jgi:hypothetical protein
VEVLQPLFALNRVHTLAFATLVALPAVHASTVGVEVAVEVNVGVGVKVAVGVNVGVDVGV